MKETKIDNFHVEVYPRISIFGITLLETESEIKRACEKIKEAILRHVDEIDSVDIVFNRKDVCSFCGRTWTEENDTYNGGCCQEDEEAEENRIKKGG